jgi:hypothetical protein
MRLHHIQGRQPWMLCCVREGRAAKPAETCSKASRKQGERYSNARLVLTARKLGMTTDRGVLYGSCRQTECYCRRGQQAKAPLTSRQRLQYGQAHHNKHDGKPFFNLAAHATKINEKHNCVTKAMLGQKFPADPRANWSGHSCSFQLAKTLPQTNLHW